MYFVFIYYQMRLLFIFVHFHKHREDLSGPAYSWDPPMKLFIVDFKMDTELNPVSQNPPVFTP